MHNTTIKELNDNLKKKNFSCKELTQHFLARIKKYDTKLNSFITINTERALIEAENIDTKIIAKQSTIPLLTGIPIAFKDNIYTKDIKTTCASKMMANFVAPYSASIVKRLQQAGCITIGKNNLDEFAMGATNETSYYGAARNPWHLDKIPGGSSGGSAAAVAARLTLGAIGTDTGGSARQPAALCGISSLKPTYKLLSNYGIVPLAPSLDHAAILATTAEDIAIILQHCVGYDVKEPDTLALDNINYSENLDDSLTGLKVGIPQECLSHLYEQNNYAVTKLYHDAIEELKNLGVKIKYISLPHLPSATPAYYALATAECTCNSTWYNVPKANNQLCSQQRSTMLGNEVKRRLMIGNYVKLGYDNNTLYAQAKKIRHLITADFNNSFLGVDIILTPTTPTGADFIGKQKIITDFLPNNFSSDIYTLIANLPGIPAISFPIGLADNMPVGLQLIGPYLSEAKLLNVVHKYQQATPWHKKMPLLD